MRSLSAHLFWDVDRTEVDWERHAAWLVNRVLEYGRWRDWQILIEYYGKPELARIAVGLRTLQPRTFAFCCAYFQLSPSDFRCFTSPQFLNQ